MTEFQYTTVLSKLPVLLEKIRTVGIPSKATLKWMESIGFKSKNDRTMLKVLQFIGFLDEAGNTTEVWKQYRGANHAQVLANAIKNGYSELFDVYPKAWECSTTELESFFSTRTTAGKQVITKTVSTFTTLCGLADFSQEKELPIVTKIKKEEPHTQAQPKAEVHHSTVQSMKPSLHINIQIHISPDATPEQIDQIFASMSKHLSDL